MVQVIDDGVFNQVTAFEVMERGSIWLYCQGRADWIC